MSQWAGVVLAAGSGIRMKSRLTKALHKVCGIEMVRYPVDLMRRVGVERVCVVVSPENADALKNLLSDEVEYAVQPTALGTGDALARTKEMLSGSADHLLVMGADSPLVRWETVERLMASHLATSVMSLLVAKSPSMGDLGRVVRNQRGQVEAVIEATDGGHGNNGFGGEPKAGEINGGVYCFEGAWLWENLSGIQPSQQGESYLTALAAIAARGGVGAQAVAVHDADELQGVNNRLQLAQVEADQRRRINQHWMLEGVTIVDPVSVFIDAEVTIGQDTTLLPNTMLLGKTSVGEGSEIGPGSVIRDSVVGSRCRVTASMLEEAAMEDDTDIGPFSHLRPGAYLESGVHIGNFAEVKESRLANGVLMGHFGYVGDASIGADVNLGAGLVTCNYDGVNKHRTNIENGAFIGCDTMLVAPVTVGARAVTGAGSVVTEDVPPGRLVVGVPARIRDNKPKSS